MAILVLCDHCGAMAPRGEVAGRCVLCAPTPEVLEAQQREVEQRHLKAVEDAKESIKAESPYVDDHFIRTRHDVAWRAVSRQAIPHLFVRGAGWTRSLCGDAFSRGQNCTPPSGVQGCRRCALAAGWIESLSESVTT